MDLEKFKQEAGEKRKGLESFIKQVEEAPPKQLDQLLEEEDVKVWQEVDCTTCANCCKTMTPVFTKADIKRIATHFRMTPKAFFDKWLVREKDSGNTVNAQQPCQFLVEDKCSIYEVRPADCAEFPHHYQRPFPLYSDTFIQNLHRCPATFNLIERLKKRIEQV